MHTHNSYYDDYPDTQGILVMEQLQSEWISTVQAAEILGVKSTQGVLNIVRGEKKPFQWIVRYWNAGTEDMPRYMLAKEDIVALAEKRKSQTTL